MNVRFFSPGKQYLKYKKDLDEAFVRTATNGDLILRDDVEKFEEMLKEYTGSKYAVALNSCTDALYLCLRYSKIGPGDEVLVPSRTFVATPQVIVQLGATPVFYDVGETPVFTEKTKAIMPVHIEGMIDPDFHELANRAYEAGIVVIEDAAQALGATLDGYQAGTYGDAGCFSFYPAKIMGALGDGGAVVTDSDELYAYLMEARNHFKFTAGDWGVNSRLDNLQAAFLNVKFPDLDNMLERRSRIAFMYNLGLKDLTSVTRPEATEERVWQDYIIRTDKRDELYDFLKENGIETMKNNYPFPVPKLPLAQAYEDETLRLPCNDVLEDEEVDYVIEKVNEFFAK